MSEKRFIVADHSTCVFDKITKEEYVCIDREEAFLVCKKLNEQQATIEQLQAKLKEKEEDEKLYANEIVELRKTNEEWLQFKSLGGDY